MTSYEKIELYNMKTIDSLRKTHDGHILSGSQKSNNIFKS